MTMDGEFRRINEFEIIACHINIAPARGVEYLSFGSLSR